jgi:hypothetical protein
MFINPYINSITELDCHRLNECGLESHKVGYNEYKKVKVNGHTIFYSESKDRERKHVLLSMA